MNKANEALAEVRRWLCDSLSDGDAGKVCGMLSVVSRRIVEIEAENSKLRELASILCFCMQIHKQCDDCKLDGTKGELVHDPLCACRELHAMLRELGVDDK